MTAMSPRELLVRRKGSTASASSRIASAVTGLIYGSGIPGDWISRSGRVRHTPSGVGRVKAPLTTTESGAHAPHSRLLSRHSRRPGLEAPDLVGRVLAHVSF